MRKIMKRNIQRQRQQRTVTYMRSTEELREQRKDDMLNAIGGVFIGLFLLWLGYKFFFGG